MNLVQINFNIEFLSKKYPKNLEMIQMQAKNTVIASSLGMSLTHNCQPVGGHHSLLGNIFGSQPQNIIVVTRITPPLKCQFKVCT